MRWTPLVKALPEFSEVAEAELEGGPRRVALIGRPNVGKSSLLDKLAGSDHVVVTRPRAPRVIPWTRS
ncbi:50S ribosome-binding GTPase [Kocuria rhizophila]|nr:50S ribosome-binding GTPase [Kocuria rhizophila]